MRTSKENRRLMKLLGYVPWDIDYLLETYPECNWFLVWSTRKNGKTYGAVEKAIKIYMKEGFCSLYLRRYENQITGADVIDITSGITSGDAVYNLTAGLWDTIEYKKRAFYLAKYDEEIDKNVLDDKPFMYLRDISHSETRKGKAIPNLAYIFFDEFIPESAINYVTDEFTQLMSILSTNIGRIVTRDGKYIRTKIFLLGNTINKYNIYFQKLGLKNAKNQKPNTEDIYKFGEYGPRVCCQYYESKKDPNKKHTIEEEYFAFDCPELSVITGGGDGDGWQLENFPLIQHEFMKDSISKKVFFIEYDMELFMGDIRKQGKNAFIAITRKTTEIKRPEKDLIFKIEVDHRINVCQNIFKPRNELEGFIYHCFADKKIFYQDLEVACAVSNFLEECRRER